MGDDYTLDRRVFLAALASGAAALLFPDRVDGRQESLHYAGIKNTIDFVEGTQDIADNWAACTQMVLSYWGVDMKRQDIASKRYAKSVRWASQNTRRQDWLSEKLSNGLLPHQKGVDVTVHSYDRLESMISSDLRKDQPVIIGNSTEVMVLTDLHYTRGPRGPQVQSAIVIDPRPGYGKRDLCSVRMVNKDKKGWHWARHSYFWNNIAYTIRITATPDRRQK